MKKKNSMKYNPKYDLYIDNDLVIYYWNKKLDKLMQRNYYCNNDGYLRIRCVVNNKLLQKMVHRIIYETFIGEIPNGYEIDHINAIKSDNRLENLRVVTHERNMNNPLTKRNISEGHKGKPKSEETKKIISLAHKKREVKSEFGKKFYEHYGLKKHQNNRLYYAEWAWWKRKGKCRWE